MKLLPVVMLMFSLSTQAQEITSETQADQKARESANLLTENVERPDQQTVCEIGFSRDSQQRSQHFIACNGQRVSTISPELLGESAGTIYRTQLIKNMSSKGYYRFNCPPGFSCTFSNF